MATFHFPDIMFLCKFLRTQSSVKNLIRALVNIVHKLRTYLTKTLTNLHWISIKIGAVFMNLFKIGVKSCLNT